MRGREEASKKCPLRHYLSANCLLPTTVANRALIECVRSIVETPTLFSRFLTPQQRYRPQ